MAVKSILTNSTAVIKVKTGVDKNGKDAFKKDRFSNVYPNANDEDVLEVLEAFKGMVKYTVVDMTRENVYDMVRE